jgi:hypothetical protein
LYIVDLELDTVRQLTDDSFADLQPAWSPDGRTLAFVTDRFTSSLEALTFGDYRLAAIEVESGAIEDLPSIQGAKNIDPQWAGAALYFIADPGGVSNVFRAWPASGEIQQITDVSTGVSGMTALSPALSVAPAAERMVFSLYSNGGYDIRSMPLSPLSGGREFQIEEPVLAAATPAAPDASGFEAKMYQPALKLDRISQPYLTAGGGALGGFFRAGVSFSFSDLLEEQQIHTAVQVGTRVRDLAVQTGYVNRQSRWTWGVVGGQLPIAFSRSRTGAIDDARERGIPVTRETITLEQTHRQLAAVAAYPFSRSRRAEFSAGFHAIGFTRDVNTRLYSTGTGKLMEEGTVRMTAAPSVSLVETGAALVHDTAVHGPAGPVLGGRSRLEVAPTLGELSFVTMTADHRRYHMPVRPLTIAWRVQHVGRYGRGAGDARLLPLVWTLRDLVRGYSPRDAAADPCAHLSTPCDTPGEFTARRLLVSNLELRVPILGPMGRLARSSGLPVDALAFADLGAFWSRPAQAGVASTFRTLRSVGAGVRLNAGGFVFEFDAVRPLDLPAKGWTLAVNFRPGF